MPAKSKRYDIWSTITLIIFLLYIIVLVFPDKNFFMAEPKKKDNASVEEQTILIITIEVKGILILLVP